MIERSPEGAAESDYFPDRAASTAAKPQARRIRLSLKPYSAERGNHRMPRRGAIAAFPLLTVWLIGTPSWLGGTPSLLAAAPAGARATNSVYAELTSPATGSPLRIAPARFAAAQAAQVQREALAEAGKPRHSVDDLLRPSVVAPHVLTMSRESLDPPSASVQQVRVVFALRGELENLAQDEFLNQLLAASTEDDQRKAAGGAKAVDGEAGEAKDGQSRPLTDDELVAAGIDVAALSDGSASEQRASGGEAYRLVRGELFSKVRIAGVIHSQWTRDDDTILMALRFDHRFADQAALKSTWERLERDDAGQTRVVERGEWAGGGAYVQLTRWADDPRMLICEAELSWIEPQAWFGGANLIGSKLPPAIQSQVREIRRAALRRSE